MFPYVGFIDYAAHGAFSIQCVFVSPVMPEWGTPLYMFPLAWHAPGGTLEGYSHIGHGGLVCYDDDTSSNITMDTGVATFWGSNFSKYDQEFVNVWKEIPDDKAAKDFAIREFMRSPGDNGADNLGHRLLTYEPVTGPQLEKLNTMKPLGLGKNIITEDERQALIKAINTKRANQRRNADLMSDY